MKVELYIPCFNAEETIRQCLDAVFRQTYPIEKIFVVDDGSTDTTVDIASGYPLRVIRHTDNKGLAAARNTAVNNMHTDFIASLDADCIAQPQWLAKLMEQFTSPGIAGSGGRLFERCNSSPADSWRAAHMSQSWGESKRNVDFLFGSNSVFRRQAIVAAGLYNESVKNNYEDVDISLRLKEKGWELIYEPSAIADHIKKDNISSILNNFWQWHFCYYQKKGFYINTQSFSSKVKDNIGLANKFLEEDLAARRYHLLYLDFLLAVHHSLKDLEYFVGRDDIAESSKVNYEFLSFWLSLIDLTFFYHFRGDLNKRATLVDKSTGKLQNFLALNLIIGKVLLDKFINETFVKRFFSHLFDSLYRINNLFLLDSLYNLANTYRNWDLLYKKNLPNLNFLFLEEFTSHFRDWLDRLIFHTPEIINMIEFSSRNTGELVGKEDFYEKL